MERNPNVNCSICDKAIYRKPYTITRSLSGRVYCSSECYGRSCRKEVPCVVCGTLILGAKHAKTCSRTCSNKNRTGIQYRKGAPKDKVKTTRALKKKLIEQRGTCCEICGFDRTKILVPHHIIEKCNGGSDELNNLMLICPNCHMTIHHDKEALPCGVVTRLENGWV